MPPMNWLELCGEFLLMHCSTMQQGNAIYCEPRAQIDFKKGKNTAKLVKRHDLYYLTGKDTPKRHD